ncbi:hypothetical protein KC333_g211 [Hortaea werneckii]|nr:hypothetical protein KC333_g211 [Hortaea werneckii]
MKKRYFLRCSEHSTITAAELILTDSSLRGRASTICRIIPSGWRRWCSSHFFAAGSGEDGIKVRHHVINSTNSDIRPRHIRTCARILLIVIERLGLLIVEVLLRVGGLVLKDLDETVECHCQQSTKNRANPIEPVIAGERMQYDARPKGACRVERAAGVEDTGQFGNEQS